MRIDGRHRYPDIVTDPAEFEARLVAVENGLEEVAADAAAARHLAAARDRDLADLGIKVDANRQAINALGVQTAAGFDEMRAKFDQVDRGFAEMRGRFDQTAAGMAQIVELLTAGDDDR